jgi:hypothetical protein
VLALQRYDLADLDREISDEKIESTIRQTLPEKAPGPDGYIRGGGQVMLDHCQGGGHDSYMRHF